MMPQPKPSASSWRDLYPAHPCAEVFPMLSDDKIAELGEDIKKHGLRHPIVLVPSATDPTLRVLDGRNRLAALAWLGVVCPTDPKNEVMIGTHRQKIFRIEHDAAIYADPAAYVITMNIRRRHLTKEQQAELILRTVEADQNDQATVARSFSPTAGQRGGSTKDATLTKAVEEAKKHGISKRTVKRARAKVQGKTAAPRKSGPTQPPAANAPAPEKPKPTELAVAMKPPASSAPEPKVRPRFDAKSEVNEVITAIQIVVLRWPMTESFEPLITAMRAEIDQLTLARSKAS